MWNTVFENTRGNENFIQGEHNIRECIQFRYSVFVFAI